jgi:hypothetical protein
MNPSENLYLFATFVGALIRTFAPFIRKFYKGEEPKFKYEYLMTFLISLVISALVALAQFVVYPLGLGLGWGSNDIINEIKAVFFPSED